MKLILTPIVKKLDSEYKSNGSIKWNFTKFVINRDGEIVDRFEPTDEMKNVRDRIMEVI